LFVALGLLAAAVAIGARSRAADSKGVLRVLLGEPFGQILLGLVTLGLVCFAVWRLTQAVFDADHHGPSYSRWSASF
jgi:hypothetical protein